MAVPGQPVVGPSAREEPGEQDERDVEDQAVDRLERRRQLLGVAHRPPGGLLDDVDEIPGEVEGPEVGEEHRGERGIEVGRLTSPAECDRIQAQPE